MFSVNSDVSFFLSFIFLLGSLSLSPSVRPFLSLSFALCNWSTIIAVLFNHKHPFVIETYIFGSVGAKMISFAFFFYYSTISFHLYGYALWTSWYFYYTRIADKKRKQKSPRTSHALVKTKKNESQKLVQSTHSTLVDSSAKISRWSIPCAERDKYDNHRLFRFQLPVHDRSLELS